MNIWVSAGDSAGHLFPALAFLESFAERFPEGRVLLVASRRAAPYLDRAAASLEPQPSFERWELEPFAFPGRPSWRWVASLARLARALPRVRRRLAAERPDLVVAFGGYLSVPVLWAAHREGIPALLHEQNARWGRASRVAARWADRIAVSFAPVDARPDGRVVFTGNLIRRKIRVRAAREAQKFRRPADILTVGVVGGSQGSRTLNRLAARALGNLLVEFDSLRVIHVAGERDCEAVRGLARCAGGRYEVRAWVDAPEDFYPQLDVLIARAGSSTLFEAALFGIPQVLVPYPRAGAHQEWNARALADVGAAEMVLERNGEAADRLEQTVRALLSDEDRRLLLASRVLAFGPGEAPERMLAEALALARARGEMFSHA